MKPTPAGLIKPVIANAAQRPSSPAPKLVSNSESGATPATGDGVAGQRPALPVRRTSSNASLSRLFNLMPKDHAGAPDKSAHGEAALPCEHAHLLEDPAFSWVKRGHKHANVLVPAGRFNDARCLVDELFRVKGQQTLFLNDPEVQEEFMNSLKLDASGKPLLGTGPFQERMNKGGVLIIHAANYTSAQLDAFNTVMEEGLYDGRKLDNPPRVVILSDEDTARQQPLSGPQMSRTEFIALTGFDFPEYRFPQLGAATREMEPGAQYVDLGFMPGSKANFFDHVGINKQQQWDTLAGELGDLESKHTLVFRNVPEIGADPYIWDFFRAQVARGRTVRIEDSLPHAQIDRLSENKSAAKDFGKTLARADAPACVINAANFDEMLEQHHGIEQGFPILRDSLLDQAASRLGEQEKLTVYVPEVLAPFQWDRLMCHPLPLQIVAAPGAMVPPRYAQQVALALPGDRPPSVPAGTAGCHVRIDHCFDPLLSDLARDGTDVKRIFVTPHMTSEDLLFTTARIPPPQPDQTGTPQTQHDPVATAVSERKDLCIVMQDLLTQLKDGKTVRLFNLECNPQLEAELASLLHPPHSIDVNGEHLRFGQGGALTGRLEVLTSDAALVENHPLCQGGTDVVDPEKWYEQCLQTLTDKFATPEKPVDRETFQRLVVLFDAMQDKGLLSSKGPALPYATIEKLYGQLFSDLPAAMSSTEVDEVRNRQIRGLFKDLLISDFRKGPGHRDDLYSELKVWLRRLFPEAMGQVPEGHVDTTRLQQLLNQVNHKKDVTDHPWQFLNAFDTPTIEALVGNSLVRSKEHDKQIAEKVMHLVLQQAGNHHLTLPPQLVKLQQSQARQISRMPVFESWLRPSKLTLDQRDLEKSRIVSSRGRGLFLKGSPGGGKTRQVNNLANGKVFDLDVAAEGTEEFSHRLREWATHPGPCTLVIDEANLAAAGSLNMLKGAFIDGTIFIEGKLHHISDQHKIVFTGNSDHFSGRRVQAMAREWMPTVQFKGVPDSALEDIFIKPLLDHAATQIPALQPAHVRQAITQTGIDIHKHLKAAFPDLGLSPRNLEELMAQTVTLLANHPEQATGANIDAWMARLAMDVYGATLPQAQRNLADTWLQRTWEEQAGHGLPALPAYQLRSDRLAMTTSTRQLIDKLAIRLRTHDRRMALNYKNEAASQSAEASGSPASQKKDTLGQPAIIIEAPAARGKDSVVCEMLKQEKRDYLHINVDPNNLAAFRKTLIDAYTTGKALVVSELNLLPSDIVEGELNALLTGQTEHEAHPKFLFIGTINPVEYGGRQEFSPAFMNRSSFLREPDYAPEELTPIAEKIIDRLYDEVDSRQAMTRTPKEKVQALVPELIQRHQALSGRLAGSPEEYRPGIRQLAAVLKDLGTHPVQDFDQLFNQAYAYYENIARAVEASGKPASLGKRSSGQSEKTAQLQNLMILKKPEWLSFPVIRPRDERTRSRAKDDDVQEAVSYDAKQHAILFDPSCTQDELAAALLALLEHPLDGDAAESQDTSRGQKVSAPSFLGTGGSGVGVAYNANYFGEFETRDPRIRMLATGSIQLDGETGPDNVEEVENQLDNSHKRIASMAIEDCPASRVDDKNMVGLAVGEHTRPVDVFIDGEPARVLHQGDRWWAESEGPASSHVDLRYRLSPVVFDGETESTQPSLPKWDLDLGQAPDLESKLEKLALAAPHLSRRDQIEQLAAIFSTSFQYGPEDARALNATNSDLARTQQMLHGRTGRCVEIANAFKMLGENFLGFPIQINRGHTVRGNALSSMGHRWIKFQDEKGRSHWFDPTRGISQSEQNRRELDDYNARNPRRQTPRTGGAGTGVPGSSRADDLDSEHDRMMEELDRFTAERLLGVGRYDEERVLPGLDRPAAERFQPASLQLVNVKYEREGKHLNGKHGKLHLPSFLAGRVDKMYADSAIKPRKELKEVLFEELPLPESDDDMENFMLTHAAPLEALKASGVTVLGYLSNENLFYIQNVNDLSIASKKPDTVALNQKRATNRHAVNLRNADFMDRLSDHYYLNLLASRNIDVSDTAAVKNCLCDQWRDAIRQNWHLSFPIKLDLDGQHLELSEQEFVENHLEWLEKADMHGARKIAEALRLANSHRNPDFVALFEKNMITLRDSAELSGTDHLAHGLIAGLSLEGLYESPRFRHDDFGDFGDDGFGAASRPGSAAGTDEDAEDQEIDLEYHAGVAWFSKNFLASMSQADASDVDMGMHLPGLLRDLLWSEKITANQIRSLGLIEQLQALPADVVPISIHSSQFQREREEEDSRIAAMDMDQDLYKNLHELYKRVATTGEFYNEEIADKSGLVGLAVTSHLDNR